MEYGASILEDTALYKAKSGEEIVNEQMYTFVDRGGREVSIRPEMTPTVARMVARRRKELAFPLRWYSIPNLFRYERPQRGRLREHWQLNLDMFGVESFEADAEIIEVLYRIMKELGAEDDFFMIRINNRRLLNYLMKEQCRLNEEESYRASKIIDRKRKLAREDFIGQMKQALGDKAKSLIGYLDIESFDALPPDVQKHESVEELRVLFDSLGRRGVSNAVFDLSLVRGLDYYTGPVFEAFDTNPENPRSLFGGGRYDDLVALFGAEKVTGVGFGMGDVTVRDFLETHGLLPEPRSSADLYICQFGKEYQAYANELARYLRDQGINVAVDLTNRTVSAQVKTADRQGIPFVICVGDDEVRTGKFKLKNMKSGKESVVTKEEIVELIRSKKLKD